jgi:hypothetical protein
MLKEAKTSFEAAKGALPSRQYEELTHQLLELRKRYSRLQVAARTANPTSDAGKDGVVARQLGKSQSASRLRTLQRPAFLPRCEVFIGQKETDEMFYLEPAEPAADATPLPSPLPLSPPLSLPAAKAVVRTPQAQVLARSASASFVRRGGDGSAGQGQGQGGEGGAGEEGRRARNRQKLSALLSHQVPHPAIRELYLDDKKQIAEEYRLRVEGGSSSSSSSSGGVVASLSKAQLDTLQTVLANPANGPLLRAFRAKIKAEDDSRVRGQAGSSNGDAAAQALEGLAVPAHTPRTLERRESMKALPPTFAADKWLAGRNKLRQRKINLTDRERYQLLFEFLDDRQVGRLDLATLLQVRRVGRGGGEVCGVVAKILVVCVAGRGHINT